MLKSNLKIEVALVAICFVFEYAVIYISHFNGLYGQDSHAYYAYSKSIALWLSGGNHPGHFFWTSFYPLICAVFSFAIKPIAAMQFISVASHVFTSLFLYKLLKAKYKLKDIIVCVYVFLFYFLSPYVFRLSTTAMSDCLCIFLLTTALFLSHQLKTFNGILNIFLFAYCLFASVMVRYAAIIPAAILFLDKGINLRQYKNPKFIIPTLAAICVAVLPDVIIKPHGFNNIISHQWVTGWSPLNFFKSTFNTLDGHSHFTLINLFYSFSSLLQPGFIFCGVFFLFFLFNRITFSLTDKQSIIIIISYALFLSGIPFQNNRFLCLTFPFIIIAFFPSFNAAYNSFSLFRYRHFLCIPLVIIQCCLIYFALKPFVKYNREEIKIAEAINKTDYKTIYTFSINQALMSYNVKPQIINMMDSSITTLDTSGVILFNEEKFSEQWEDKLPMQNWNYFYTHYKLCQIADFSNGWKLYETK